MEFSNIMYMQDEETENQNVSTHDHDGSRNFVNPVYETMFQVLFGKSIKSRGIFLEDHIPKNIKISAFIYQNTY